MKLFNNKYTNDYTNEKVKELKIEIDKIPDEEILRIDINEFKKYYYEKYSIKSINLLKQDIDSSLEKTKIEEYNPFFSTLPYELEERTYLVDGYKINYKIPFEGDLNLLYLIPKMSILTDFVVDDIVNTNSEEYLPCILFSIEIKASELEKNDNPQKLIDETFIRKFKNYECMVNYVNNDIQSYNTNLNKIIDDYLENRKSKSSNFSDLMNKLSIPLKNNNFTNSTPINLKVNEKKVKYPEPNADAFKEYNIKDSDYININNIIKQACISFERTARTFNKLEEEEIRDFLLASLNTHYNSLATGETFSKNGKTDIRIQFENKAAYVAECKIWHGISEFDNAIKQLFSYITWRDVKTSLVVFNKNNKDFKSLLSKVRVYLDKNELCISIKEIEQNNWQYVFKKDIESSERIELNILLCDIFI